MQPKDKYSLKEDLAVIAKHMQDLVKNDDDSIGAKYAKEMKSSKIGTTQSGKGIYGNADHEAHSDFSPQDHADAAEVHSKAIHSSTAEFRKQHHMLQGSKHQKKMYIPVTSQDVKSVN